MSEAAIHEDHKARIELSHSRDFPKNFAARTSNAPFDNFQEFAAMVTFPTEFPDAANWNITPNRSTVDYKASPADFCLDLPTVKYPNILSPYRVSFLPTALREQLIMMQLAQYPPEILRNPYVPEEMDNGDNITSIHIAAGTGNVDLLKSKINVFLKDSADMEGRTPLVYAVIGNHRNIIKILLNYGASVNMIDTDGRSCIHWAAYYSRVEILRILLRHGANWRLRDEEGRTAIHWATGNESTKCLNILLSMASSFEVNEADLEQMTPLHWSAYHNNPKHLKLLLEQNADYSLTDVEGKTALHWCAPHKDISCAMELVMLGGKELLNMSDLDGRTVLHLACAENNVSLVSYLLSFSGCIVDARDISLRTALHWAAVSGHHNLVTLLLEHNASDAIKDSTGATALHYACSKNHAQCVATLLSRTNASYLLDKDGRPALTWAVSKGHVQTVRLLLDKKVDCNLADKDGITALHAAAQSGQTHCVSLLLEHGAKVDALDNYGLTPLFKAVEKGYAEVANILIQSHADVNLKDTFGKTPLHWASSFGHLPVLSLVLANGARIDEPDFLGETAMVCGSANGHNEVVKYLIESGANINHSDMDNLTPLHWAAASGHSYTAELLLVAGAQPNSSNKQHTMCTPFDMAQLENQLRCGQVMRQYGCLSLTELFDVSALKIQRLWKGYRTRKELESSILTKVKNSIIKRFKMARQDRQDWLISRDSLGVSSLEIPSQEKFKAKKKDIQAIALVEKIKTFGPQGNAVESSNEDPALSEAAGLVDASSSKSPTLDKKGSNTTIDESQKKDSTIGSTELVRMLSNFQKELENISSQQKALDKMRRETEMQIDSLSRLMSDRSRRKKSFRLKKFVSGKGSMDKGDSVSWLVKSSSKSIPPYSPAPQTLDFSEDKSGISHPAFETLEKGSNNTTFDRHSLESRNKEGMASTMDSAERAYFKMEEKRREKERN